MPEPIVITGMGVVSPLGCSVAGMWRRLIASESGLRRLPDDIVPDIDAKVAGIVPAKGEGGDGFDPDAPIAVEDRRKMDRFIRFTLVAADQALRQSGWKPSSEAERVRTATVVASGIGGFQAITDAVETVGARGASRLSPFTVPAFLVNLVAGHVTIRHGFKGPPGAPATVSGDAAKVDPVGRFAGPTGVTVAGDGVWVAEGRQGLLPASGKDGSGAPSFDLRSVGLGQIDGR